MCSPPNLRISSDFARSSIHWLKWAVILGLILGPYYLEAQFGGQKSFQFLNLPTTTRVAALGGVNVSSYQDAQMFMSNPGLLDTTNLGHAGLTYQSLVADINYGTLTYVHEFNMSGVWGFGVQYLDYGDFRGFDPSGAPTGTFSGSEFALVIGYAQTSGSNSIRCGHQVYEFGLGRI